MKIKLLVSGILAMVASLWIGSWCLEALKTTWMEFPAFMTCVCLFYGGMWITILGVRY